MKQRNKIYHKVIEHAVINEISPFELDAWDIINLAHDSKLPGDLKNELLELTEEEETKVLDEYSDYLDKRIKVLLT